MAGRHRRAASEVDSPRAKGLARAIFLLVLPVLLIIGVPIVGAQTIDPLHYTAPKLIWFRAAGYPPEALEAGREAEIHCTLHLDDRGAVLLADCADGPPEVLVHAAQSALEKCLFEPGRVKGWPVFSHLELVYRFALAFPNERQAATRAVLREIEGDVFAQGVRAPVAGADIVAEGLGLSTSTDGKGHFKLALPLGSQVLVASSQGNHPEQLRVEIGKDTPSPIQVELALRPRETQELQATVATDKDHRAASREVLVREELRNVPGSQDDPIRVVELLPGIARAPNTSGQLIVRGGNANDTGAYIDGQQVPQLYHLQNGPSVVGEEMVERIDFSAGGAGADYGRNLAGVVSIASRRGDPERWHGSLSIDLQKSAAFLQGPLGGDTEVAMGARHSYSNPLQEGRANRQLSYTVPIYWDYQLRLDHRLGAHDQLTLTAFGSHDDYEQIGDGRGEVPASLAQETGFHRVRLAWEHHFDGGAKLVVAPVFGVDTNRTDRAGQGAGIFLLPQGASERTVSSGARAEFSWRPAPFASLRLGLDMLFNRVHYDVDQLFESQLRQLGAPNAEATHSSGIKVFGSVAEYLDADLTFGDLHLIPGARVEELHYGIGNFVLFEPRVRARYQLDNPSSIVAYAGIYHQAPEAEEVDRTLGNPGLLPLRADQYGLALERRFAELWTIKLEVFFNVRTSLVFPAAPHLLDDGAITNPLFLNSGRGHAYGLEVFIRHVFNARVYGWLAYTLSRSRETSGFGAAWLPGPYDQPHVLNALFGVRISPLLEFAVRLRVASGNPIAPVISSAYDADTGTYIPVTGQFGSARLPTFAQLDFEVNSVWLAERFQLSLYVDFQNILGRDNPELVFYDYRFQQSVTALSTPFQILVGAKAAF